MNCFFFWDFQIDVTLCFETTDFMTSTQTITNGFQRNVSILKHICDQFQANCALWKKEKKRDVCFTACCLFKRGSEGERCGSVGKCSFSGWLMKHHRHVISASDGWHMMVKLLLIIRKPNTTKLFFHRVWKVYIKVPSLTWNTMLRNGHLDLSSCLSLSLFFSPGRMNN